MMTNGDRKGRRFAYGTACLEREVSEKEFSHIPIYTRSSDPYVSSLSEKVTVAEKLVLVNPF